MRRFQDNDIFGVCRELSLGDGRSVHVYSLPQLEAAGLGTVSRLPYSIRILLECVLRNLDGSSFQEAHVRALAGWKAGEGFRGEIPFLPARVILQDFTGVPALVDLAAMRDAVSGLGGDPARVNPDIPCDLVVDHSIQVDCHQGPEALQQNEAKELERNRERYLFLKWGLQAFRNLRVVPPGKGIVHQVNLEHLSSCVFWDRGKGLAYPDTCLGADSHTTMVNALGVLAWGVGGIEVEAAMLAQPVYMPIPDVLGFRLERQLPKGVTATDLVLRITEMCRQRGVVGKFLEFFGSGVEAMSIPDRATIGNMAPEQGSTVSYFPIDGETLRYLRLTGRSDEEVLLVERYARAQGLFRGAGAPEPQYSEVLTLDLSTVEPCISGPKRPQDRLPLAGVPQAFRAVLKEPKGQGAPGLSRGGPAGAREVPPTGEANGVPQGAVAIAAITSCTNTSNPSSMICAGLLARNAVMKGLRVRGYVKPSLAPGSRVVTQYLKRSGLLPYLEALGFYVVGYGCTTCIGNSGPLEESVQAAVLGEGLAAAAVLSGNRNFEGRINPLIRYSYLASPPLVVAYAIAGSMAVDLVRDPLGRDEKGDPVYLRDIWPHPEEISGVVEKAVDREMFMDTYRDLFSGSRAWQDIHPQGTMLYPWEPGSTYVRHPPFFEGVGLDTAPVRPVVNARVLALFGDSITTDHISPAGAITPGSPAARYLLAHGVPQEEWNTYGSRRGNHEVMVRGTFANPRIRNLLVPGAEGNVTCYHPTGERLSLYEAAMRYQRESVPLIVIAGREYGAGSSRDWAAKGPMLLGVRAVLALGFERIHRSNLIGMGILPLQFLQGHSPGALGLKGTEFYDILVDEGTAPGGKISVRARAEGGEEISFEVQVRLDTPAEKEIYGNGGVLPRALRKIAREAVFRDGRICLDKQDGKGYLD